MRCGGRGSVRMEATTTDCSESCVTFRREETRFVPASVAVTVISFNAFAASGNWTSNGPPPSGKVCVAEPPGPVTCTVTAP